MGEAADAKRVLVVWWSLLVIVILGGVAMPGRQLPLVLSLVVLMAFVKSLVRARSALPERVATHFTLGLAADGWMSRRGYLVLIAVLAGALGVVLPLGVFLAAEQFGNAKLQRLALWLMPMIGGWLLGMNELLVKANEREPAVLSRWIWVLMGLLLVAINWWTLAMTLPW